MMCRPGAEATSAVENLLDMFAAVYDTVTQVRTEKATMCIWTETADPVGFVSRIALCSRFIHMPALKVSPAPDDLLSNRVAWGCLSPEISGGAPTNHYIWPLIR